MTQRLKAFNKSRLGRIVISSTVTLAILSLLVFTSIQLVPKLAFATPPTSGGPYPTSGYWGSEDYEYRVYWEFCSGDAPSPAEYANYYYEEPATGAEVTVTARVSFWAIAALNQQTVEIEPHFYLVHVEEEDNIEIWVPIEVPTFTSVVNGNLCGCGKLNEKVYINDSFTLPEGTYELRMRFFIEGEEDENLPHITDMVTVRRFYTTAQGAP